jgi:hypothetical protein
MMLARGWYRFDDYTGPWFWDGLRWHGVMPCPPPEGEPIKSEPPG